MSQQVKVSRELEFQRGGSYGNQAGPIITTRAFNDSGGALAKGDVVIWDTADSTADVIKVTTTTAGNNPEVFGMALETIPNQAIGKFQVYGPTSALKVNGTTDIAIGDLIGTFTTAKIGQKTSGAGAFARAMEAYATNDSAGVIDAFINCLGLNSGVGVPLYRDGVPLFLGTDMDIAIVERATILDTNTILAGVLLGTPVTPAIAANSLIISNTTASGDILLAANNGGNSQAWLWVDSSAGTMTLYGAGTAAAVVSATSIAASLDVTVASGFGLNVGSTTQATISNGDGATNLIPEMQALGVGTAFAGGTLLLGTFNATNDRTVSPKLAFLKGAAATQVATTAVANDEVVGSIIAYGSDSADFETPVAAIEFVVDDSGGPAAGQIGGSIEFYTTADGGETLTKALTLGTDQSATFAGVIVLPDGASINGTTSITVNNNSADVDFIVESNGNANMFTVDAGLDAIGIGGAAVANQTLTITNATLNATAGRIAKFSGTGAAPNLGDGYGVVEIDYTASGTLAGFTVASSTWVNLAAAAVPGSNIVSPRNDGIWLPSGITATNMIAIIGGRMQYVPNDGADCSNIHLFDTNIYDNVLKSLFRVNAIADMGGSTGAQTSNDYKVPLFYDVTANQLWYVNIYHS